MPQHHEAQFQPTPRIIDLAFKAAETATSDLQVARTNLARIRKTEAVYPDEAVQSTLNLWAHLQELRKGNNFDLLLRISTKLDTLLNFILTSPVIKKEEILPFLKDLDHWAKANNHLIDNHNFKLMLRHELQTELAQAA